MKVLGFDTASAATTVAFLDTATGREHSRRDDPSPGERPRHANRLLPLAVEVLADAGETWGSIDSIAVGLGPGTFTGLRIGIATARALSQARGLSIVGISTLRALALNALTNRGEPSVAAVLAAIDARRGEVFADAWRLVGGSLDGPLLEAAAVDPETLAKRLEEIPEAPLALGSGALEFRSYLEPAGAFVPGDHSVLHSVDALNHCRLAAAGEGVRTLEEIKPQYLRLPDAELARRKRAAH